MSKEPRQDARAILAANVRTLIRRFGSQPDLARTTGVAQKTISRALNNENAANLDTINALAEKIGLHPWHLLVPNLDPDNPPAVAEKSVTPVKLEESHRVHPSTLSRLPKHGGPIPSRIGPSNKPHTRQRKRGTDDT